MSTTSHDSESEDTPVRLADILTIGQRYKASTLNAPAADKALYKPDTSLLERISIYQGDITKLKIDSIVNAANKSLLGGGGVDGAIHRAAGPHLVDECRTLNGCMTGDAKITRGYKLPSRHVIHTVGPIYSGYAAEEKARKLASCYKRSLDVAVENEVRHIAFPSISTGIYGYPIQDATRIALDEVRRFVESESGKQLDRVIFVVWSDKDLNVYNSLVPEYFPPVQEGSEAQNNDAEEQEVKSVAKEAPDMGKSEAKVSDNKPEAEDSGHVNTKAADTVI